MAIRFLNTYTRALEEFRPLDPAGKTVKIYTCGPTVYNYAHIGNFRAYLFEDLLQRHLEASGYQVNRVMNLTDVDDKTIRGCRAAGLPLAQFTQKFKDAFFEDLKTLRIKPATTFPAATDPVYIARMIGMIGHLVEHGYAYQAEDKSVYFRLNKFPDYGKLAHLNLEELRPTGRIANDEYEKESVGDFALWKAWDEADGDVAWESPWGKGRPGWHIECSAMATGLLGDEIDIHCGGVDNIFPHHEAEIAQAECCTGHKFVRTWLHCAHLMVEGQKMSKSAGNFFTLRDLLQKGWSGREIRYVLLSVNYRLPLNFTFESLAAARSALGRIDEWIARLAEKAGSGQNASAHPLADPTRFAEALGDDLNISGALGVLFEMIRETNRALDRGELTPADARALLNTWEKINATLQFQREEEAISQAVLDLVEARAAARAAKNWAESDALRAKIDAAGWSVKDSKEGQKLSRK
ncbi:MAG: cysteine--tRNA ligase [Chthoniobacteraceae bacterium]|nr:cysteine--tRNA ligase [Chthoniobacteraceae bacterium]